MVSENHNMDASTDQVRVFEGNNQTPRRGSTLEGRVRALLQTRGYFATTNKIVLDHEIDVLGPLHTFVSPPKSPNYALTNDMYNRMSAMDINYPMALLFA